MAEDLTGVEIRLVRQVSLHASKKPAAGGLPSWFTGASGQRKAHSAQLQGNRRMLRRQKAHHHSVEDEWLKCHRRCLPPSASNSVPSCGSYAVLWGRGVYAELALERHIAINECASRYVEELEGNEASASAWDVLFYGDSIMEEWR